MGKKTGKKSDSATSSSDALNHGDAAYPIGFRVYTQDMDDGQDIPEGGDMGMAADMDAPLLAVVNQPAPAPMTADARVASGQGLVEFARAHVGERYIYGARVPMANPDWKGPWDCAEFVSWCVFHYAGRLFGTRPTDKPLLADAYTGYWAAQAEQQSLTLPWQEAATITGAILLRKPTPGLGGHIVIADGKGGTVEAHSSKRGVCAAEVSGRRWDYGILLPGLDYFRSDEESPEPVAPRGVLRVTQPLMRGDNVLTVQRKLADLGYPVGRADGVYGPQTAYAVALFQAQKGLVADGEAGPMTRQALMQA